MQKPFSWNARRWGVLALLTVALTVAPACGSDDDAGNNGGGQADAGADAGGDTGGDVSGSAIEIVGTYDNNFGGTETITADTWDVGVVQTIIAWDNAENWTVTQNPDDAEFSPSKFNKLVWTEPDANGEFYYCTVTFDEETAEAARTTDKTADPSDPENTGCGGFAWTKLTPVVP